MNLETVQTSLMYKNECFLADLLAHKLLRYFANEANPKQSRASDKTLKYQCEINRYNSSYEVNCDA